MNKKAVFSLQSVDVNAFGFLRQKSAVKRLVLFILLIRPKPLNGNCSVIIHGYLKLIVIVRPHYAHPF